MKSLSRRSLVTTSLLTLTLVAPPAMGQTLGTVEFPNSGAPAAQEAFVRGVSFLHSFEYGPAAEAFREAQQIDPAFALAYWGEALTYTHPVWNQQDRDQALAALQRLAPTPEARRARASTAREKAYLQAVEILYGDGSKETRDTLYSQAMEQLAAQYPDDLEAKAFYALSLLGLSQGDRNISTYMRAGAVAQEVFDKNRNHPGAVHYLIHSFDDPTHAPLGLTAARAYAKIAPDAAHAQHMTSHIFVARGMWDDVVAANETAMAVVNRNAAPAERGTISCGHYDEWLHYGYLQQGRYAEAATRLDACRAFVERTGNRMFSLAILRAANVVDSRKWEGTAVAVAVDTARIEDGAALVDFATGFAAAMRRDLPVAKRALASIEARRRQALARVEGEVPSAIGTMEVGERVLRGAIAFAERNGHAAISELERAAELEESLPFEFGPPRTPKPPRELLGEVLLQLDRSAEARRQFDLALDRTPRRALALLGLARAAASAGEIDRAVRAYETLLEVWHLADAGLPELAEARSYLAKHATSAG